MDLRCPKCNSTDLKKVSLAYQEGLYRTKARTRVGGVVAGADGPELAVGRATTRGTQQSVLSKALRPPAKWSYWKIGSRLALALDELPHECAHQFGCWPVSRRSFSRESIAQIGFQFNGENGFLWHDKLLRKYFDYTMSVRNWYRARSTFRFFGSR